MSCAAGLQSIISISWSPAARRILALQLHTDDLQIRQEIPCTCIGRTLRDKANATEITDAASFMFLQTRTREAINDKTQVSLDLSDTTDKPIVISHEAKQLYTLAPDDFHAALECVAVARGKEKKRPNVHGITMTIAAAQERVKRAAVTLSATDGHRMHRAGITMSKADLARVDTTHFTWPPHAREAIATALAKSTGTMTLSVCRDAAWKTATIVADTPLGKFSCRSREHFAAPPDFDRMIPELRGDFITFKRAMLQETLLAAKQTTKGDANHPALFVIPLHKQHEDFMCSLAAGPQVFTIEAMGKQSGGALTLTIPVVSVLDALDLFADSAYVCFQFVGDSHDPFVIRNNNLDATPLAVVSPLRV